MKRYSIFTTLLLAVWVVNAATAQQRASVAQWDRAGAQAAIQTVNVGLEAGKIRDLDSLKAVEQRNDWPLPAREASIYEFTRSLAVRPRDDVAPDVMRYLLNYQSRVLVPHEDHAGAALPLFNIRAAATGVENGWIRDESAASARLLLTTDPHQFVPGYFQATNPNQQSGYLDALQNADLVQVQAIQSTALDWPEGSPALTQLLAVTAVITTEPVATKRLLLDGRGASLAPALVALANHMSTADTANMLQFAINQAPARNAALAIAAWWPALKHDESTRQLLLARLGHPTLGAAAALALAQDPDILTIRQLQLTAAGNSMASQRAQLALNISRESLHGGVRK